MWPRTVLADEVVLAVDHRRRHEHLGVLVWGDRGAGTKASATSVGFSRTQSGVILSVGRRPLFMGCELNSENPPSLFSYVSDDTSHLSLVKVERKGVWIFLMFKCHSGQDHNARFSSSPARI